MDAEVERLAGLIDDALDPLHYDQQEAADMYRELGERFYSMADAIEEDMRAED